MIRLFLLLLATASPFLLVYFFGYWVLVGFVVVAAAVFAFSTGKGRGAEATQGGRLTGYNTTIFTKL